MAQAAGFSCDVCNTFTLGQKNGSSIVTPDGWMSLKVRTPQERDNLLDICSNLCLARLGDQRLEAETGTSYGMLAKREIQRNYQREAKAKRRAQGIRN